MNALLQPARDYLSELWTAVGHGWNAFWFKPADAATLGAIRICTALVFLYIHATCTPYLLDFVGPNGWVDQQAIAELRDPDLLAQRVSQATGVQPDREQMRWTALSLWFWVQNPTVMWILHGVFLASIVCMLLGFYSRTATILVWMGHISYIQRGYNIWFGMDTILLMVTLYLMFAPTGAALSIDRLIARFRQARQGLRARDRALAECPTQPLWTANTAIRLIQIHMCLIYLVAGLAKLQGFSWWNGLAGWFTIMIPEFRIMDLSMIAHLPDWMLYLLTGAMTYTTLIFEIGFSFLVWHRLLRPLVLTMAFFIHLGIAVFMGLGGFASIMLAGVLAFVPPASLRFFLRQLFRGADGMRFVYDRQQPATLRAASLIRAADPWGQVALVESHDTTVSPGTLLLADGTALRGGAAFGRLFRALRIFWVAWPLAMWPFFAMSKEEMAPAGAR